MRLHAFDLKEHPLNLGGEDIDTAYHQHIIAATGDSGHPHHSPAALTRLGNQFRDVPGAEPDYRLSFFGQRGYYQFTFLTIGQLFSRSGVYYLNQEMVFPDMHAILVLALYGDAGADYLGQSIYVNGRDAQPFLYVFPHLLRPGLRTVYAQAKLSLSKGTPHLFSGFVQYQGISRSTGNDGSAQVLHQQNLALGIAAACGDNRSAEALASVVKPESPREQA